MTSGQETEWVYSWNPWARTGRLRMDYAIYRFLLQFLTFINK